MIGMGISFLLLEDQIHVCDLECFQIQMMALKGVGFAFNPFSVSHLICQIVMDVRWALSSDSY